MDKRFDISEVTRVVFSGEPEKRENCQNQRFCTTEKSKSKGYALFLYTGDANFVQNRCFSRFCISSSNQSQVERAHNADLHCVDWNPLDVNLILSGSADNTVRMFDRRNLTSGPINIFEGHTEAVNCVQWSPDRSSVFGSAAEDGVLNIWDYKLVDQQNKSTGLFFRHAGHRDKVVDFHFNSSDPWTIVSVSDDSETEGGTLQIWRMLDLLYKPEEEALADLEKIKTQMLT